MLYFTGWGLSTEGKLKPDVTLPGGMIYSAIPNGSYDMDGGTSMATPHAAGATALIKQALEERFPQYSPEQIHTLLRQLVMSTAKPHKDKGKQYLFFSPPTRFWSNGCCGSCFWQSVCNWKRD